MQLLLKCQIFPVKPVSSSSSRLKNGFLLFTNKINIKSPTIKISEIPWWNNPHDGWNNVEAVRLMKNEIRQDIRRIYLSNIDAEYKKICENYKNEQNSEDGTYAYWLVNSNFLEQKILFLLKWTSELLQEKHGFKLQNSFLHKCSNITKSISMWLTSGKSIAAKSGFRN